MQMLTVQRISVEFQYFTAGASNLSMYSFFNIHIKHIVIVFPV